MSELEVPANGQYGNINIASDCDLCLIKNLQFQAESPYYDGPDVFSSSLYQSKTSSCGVTGMDLTSIPLTVYTPTSTSNLPAPTCSGKTYTVQPGDDCHSISIAQGISTSWLLLDNNLLSGCAEFPTSGNLCLVNTCAIVTVQTNDTCASIATAHNITVPQLKAWNPNINAGCYNVANMVEDQLCVAKPGTPYVPGTSTVLAPVTPTSPVAVPTDIAAGTNTYCGEYYRVELGDFCNKLVLKFGISLVDFVFLNPAINENCTNLFAAESYCVEAVGDINTYSGRPGYASYTATITSMVGDPATKLPDVTYTFPTPTGTSDQPLATGTRDDCFQYFNGSRYIGGVQSGSYYQSDCDYASHVFLVSLQDLGVWNPCKCHCLGPRET
jgi:LysM repeat protein